jgi:hypothetical protein
MPETGPNVDQEECKGTSVILKKRTRGRPPKEKEGLTTGEYKDGVVEIRRSTFRLVKDGLLGKNKAL